MYSAGTKTGFACEGSELTIRCPEKWHIHVENANYGRMTPQICNDHGDAANWNVSCKAPKAKLVIMKEYVQYCAQAIK